MRSPVTGFNIIPVSLSRLTELVNATKGRVSYELGAKPHAGADPKMITASDCSGFVRWLLPLVCTEHIDVPDGSTKQHDWCRQMHFKATPYQAVPAYRDFRLRIAFIRPKGCRVGHVWLILNGYTIECCGGEGVCRRLASTPALMKGVDECYVLTDQMD